MKRTIKTFAVFLIESNLYIALAAAVLTFATQLLLNQTPGFHPYLFIIFFATFFDYNLHRLYTLHFAPEALQGERHAWLLRNKQLFYGLMITASIGFLISISQAKPQVILTLLPFAGLTLFYSIPFWRWNKQYIRLRDIPYSKIFLIASNWTMISVLLPLVQYGRYVPSSELIWIILERFFFVWALCMPFDIRDIATDRAAGLKTIPNTLGINKSANLAYISLIISVLLSVVHRAPDGQYLIILSFVISTVCTSIAISIAKKRYSNLFLYGVIDGMLLLHALLLIAACLL